MPNQIETIRKFVNYLNNSSEQGGYWLPNIQRPFVWKKEQIEKLYDSILRQYPIGTLLVWKTKSPIKRRKFIDNYKKNSNLLDFYVPEDDETKMLVLDGQQRLQSLFIGLRGSYDGEELYFDILSGKGESAEDIKFIFKFLKNSSAKFPFVRFKDLVFSNDRTRIIAAKISENISCSEEEKGKIFDNIEIVREVFCTQDNILFQLIDGVDRKDVYEDDDIVEIFIRANSGGTFLGKSDLLFSLLTVSWDEAEKNIDELLYDLNSTGYRFNRDFILKVALVLLNKGAKYEISKFRSKEVKSGIEEQWEKIAKAVRFVKDFIYSRSFLKTDETLPSDASLIPLIYTYFHFPESWKVERLADYLDYLVKVNLTGVFGGVNDSFTDALINCVKENKGFLKNEIFGVIKEKGKSIEVTRESLLLYKYSSNSIHLLFNLWYGFNYQPAWDGNKPQIDHIFPQRLLKEEKIINPETGKKTLWKYKTEDRDQIANLMLLTALENGSANKSDTEPHIWFENKSEDYLEKHLIPRDKNLWKIDRYEDFIEARKILLVDYFIRLGIVRSEVQNISEPLA